MKQENNRNMQELPLTRQALRTFGFIMGGMFALLFGLLFPWLFDTKTAQWPIWPFVVMAVFFTVALSRPNLLRPVHAIWMKIGHALGWLNSRIILGIMFYGLILPTGLLLKLFGKDVLERKLDKTASSYRKVVRQRPKTHFERPF